MPAYVTDIAVARYLGIAPWELMDAPARWIDAAAVVMDAEARADRAASR